MRRRKLFYENDGRFEVKMILLKEKIFGENPPKLENEEVEQINVPLLLLNSF